MTSRSHLIPHIVAFLTVAVWGSTFVFTKLLLQAGLSPAQIFTLRFIIAYVLLLAYSMSRQHQWLCSSWKDELLMVALGITGGSLYFLTENAAMLYTTATNTSLIVCSCPLFAMLLFAIVYRQSEHITKVQALGSVIACLGMAVVVLGDMLAFGACLCWAVYSLLMKKALEEYSTLFITRKVFFYGIITIIPYYIIRPEEASIFNLSIFQSFNFTILLNLLFLAVVASLLCFLTWNWVISKLGAVVATNWVYFNPITTILFAWWLLHEQITIWFLLGTILILAGMYLSDRKKKK